jgi:hypothetical protein
MYNAYITKLKDIRKHSNADRLNVGVCFGNSVIVGLDMNENDLILYFPTDGRLSMDFAVENNLLRKKDAEGNNIGGYLDDNRHISTLKLRGEISDGLVMKLESLSKFTDISKLKEGDTITTLNGKLICEKYIPTIKNIPSSTSSKVKIKKANTISYPLFAEHVDTSQLAYNKHQFKVGDTCYITLKMHGTSQRSANTIKKETRKIPYVLYKLLKLIKKEIKAKKTWEYVTGTRRVVLKTFEGGYYGNDLFRKKYHDEFANKLKKGITVYYEVVGYANGDKTIMSECSNKKTKDKEFIKQYGATTRFTYGCESGESDMYVYRMTMTNEDDDVVEIPWEVVKLYCEQMGVKHCPQFDKFIFTTIEDLMERVNTYVDGTDPVGKTHIREGIVIRIDNREKFTSYKHKNVPFKILEGIIKEDNVVDMEEVESQKGEV